jgi:hypothetical protein
VKNEIPMHVLQRKPQTSSAELTAEQRGHLLDLAVAKVNASHGIAHASPVLLYLGEYAAEHDHLLALVNRAVRTDELARRAIKVSR